MPITYDEFFIFDLGSNGTIFAQRDQWNQFDMIDIIWLLMCKGDWFQVASLHNFIGECKWNSLKTFKN